MKRLLSIGLSLLLLAGCSSGGAGRGARGHPLPHTGTYPHCYPHAHAPSHAGTYSGDSV